MCWFRFELSQRLRGCASAGGGRPLVSELAGCRQLEHLETQTLVVALGDRKNNRKQRNEALTSFVSPLFPQKDNLSISLIHPQASSHTFCLKRQVLTNFRAFFSSKLSNEILLKEKKRKIIGAVALCGTWLAGQEVVPAGEGRQPRQASQPCGVPALQAPASPANSPCD